MLWSNPVEDTSVAQRLEREFALHPVIARLLVSRGLHDSKVVHDFLYSHLHDLHDPFLLADMGRAVERIKTAIHNKEPILIYSDNDVDGMTGAALLTDCLTKMGAQTFYYVPNRSLLKQSLLLDALAYAVKRHCKLLITVDCGIGAASEIAEVTKGGVDVIITDHHEPTDRLPHTVATLNPKLLNSHYPNRELTGVGVAFKLACALQPPIDLKQYLDLVALGTIADMGSLRGENRILVQYGLQHLRRPKRIGLTKLFNIGDVNQSELNAVDIASKVAPRLNSLGRVAEPRKGVELLLTDDATTAEKLAKQLDLHNTTRQQIEAKVAEDVESKLAVEDKAIILHADSWHPGVIPIIATRIAKQYNRPTILIAIEKGIGKGSARTIPEFPLLPALKELTDLLVSFGGHNFAAGLTIREKNIAAFKERFTALANNQLSHEDLRAKIKIDARSDFDLLTFDLMEAMALLEPFGIDNPPPVFSCIAEISRPPRRIGSHHIKFYLKQGERLLEGIGFNMADRLPEIQEGKLHILYTPVINRFQNRQSIQLQIRDFKPEFGVSAPLKCSEMARQI